MSKDRKPILEVEGPAAPPRRNGELVFQEPWEGRSFGIAVALGDQEVFPWEAFRDRLKAAVARADAHPAGGPRPDYYQNWLAALRRLLVESRILTPEEIEDRMRQFARGERDIVDPGAPGQ